MVRTEDYVSAIRSVSPDVTQFGVESGTTPGVG
jgi:hypothetical protein